MQKTILLLKRALGIPYVNRIDFLLFVYIKTFRKKLVFIWMQITMTAIIEGQRARLYTKKAKIIAKCFYIQKAIHLTLRDYHEIFEVGIYIQKA